MLDYLSLDNAQGAAVTLHGGEGGRAIAKADGLVGLSAPREVVRPRAQGHGSLNDTRWMGDRLIVLQGECWGSTHAEALDRFDAMAEAAYDTLAEPRLLKWQRAGGGVELQTAVKLAAELKPPLEGVGRFLRYQLQLRAADPRAFDQALRSATGASLSGSGGGRAYPLLYPYTYQPSGSGAATLLVEGRAPTPPVLTLYGYCVNPILQLDSTGERIVLDGEIGPGDFLEIDLGKPASERVLLNGSASRLGLVDFEQTTWWDLPRGPQSVSLLASSFDANARVDVRYRPAYL